MCECARNHIAQGGGVAHIQLFCVKLAGVGRDQIVNFRQVANSADHDFAALQDLFSQLAAKAAANAGDKPGTSCHRKLQ